MSHLFCNFIFVFLGTKGTIVFCCSEILGQLDVFQDSSVVGPESLLPSWTGSVCVHVCASVSVHFWSCTCGHMWARAGTCVCACIHVYVHLRVCLHMCEHIPVCFFQNLGSVPAATCAG